MEVETAQPPSISGSSPAAGGGYPCWVVLEQRCKGTVVDDGLSCAKADAAKTLAASRTRTGHTIQVSLSIQEPPATSSVRVRFPHGVHLNYCNTMAAHGDSLLLVVNSHKGWYDHFVYNAGDAATDPPRLLSLLLLPPSRELRTNCTGMLRPLGQDEVVVAEMKTEATNEDRDNTKTKVAELLVFRSGAWSVEHPRICCANNDEQPELLSDWATTSVFPVGDRTLCWVDEISDDSGVLIGDLLEETPWLQYLPLPLVPTHYFARKVCATASAGAGTLKFIVIFPRCCCGGPGASDCQRSHNAYTINTWTLRMDGGMEWVMDGMVDATELWSLDTYKGLPRVPLGFPIVSMYESHIICFALCERYHEIYDGDRTLWLLMVNMRSKTIQSVSRHPDWMPDRFLIISSNVSHYLNPSPTCSSYSSDGTLMDQRLRSEIDNEKKKRDGNGTTSMLQSPSTSSAEPATQANDEILAAFREIPSYGLACEDMLKAYAILSSDNGAQVRSLLRQPMKVRKDWLLMEIKADDA